MNRPLRIIILIAVILILLMLSGCALLSPAPPTIPVIPTSGWESVMKVVAKSDWIVTFCLLAFFSGIVTVAMDVKKIGISIIIASIMTLFLGLAVNRFPTWMAVIGFIGSAGICLIVVLKRKKALVEIIRGVQQYRNTRFNLDRLNDNEPYVDADLRNNQSVSTEKVIKEVKKNNNIS